MSVQRILEVAILAFTLSGNKALDITPDCNLFTEVQQLYSTYYEFCNVPSPSSIPPDVDIVNVNNPIVVLDDGFYEIGNVNNKPENDPIVVLDDGFYEIGNLNTNPKPADKNTFNINNQQTPIPWSPYLDPANLNSFFDYGQNKQPGYGSAYVTGITVQQQKPSDYYIGWITTDNKGVQPQPEDYGNKYGSTNSQLTSNIYGISYPIVRPYQTTSNNYQLWYEHFYGGSGSWLSEGIVQCSQSTLNCEKYCSDADGGNWIVFQSRNRSTTQSFDRPWLDYAKGFGDLSSGYWMGLECLHRITLGVPHELLVWLKDSKGNTALAHYKGVTVGPSDDYYRLHLGPYLGGSAGDALRGSEGAGFTTADRDSDSFVGNCAVQNQGGWWYTNCQSKRGRNSLNGFFAKTSAFAVFPGVRWDSWNTTAPLVATRLSIRRQL